MPYRRCSKECRWGHACVWLVHQDFEGGEAICTRESTKPRKNFVRVSRSRKQKRYHLDRRMCAMPFVRSGCGCLWTCIVHSYETSRLPEIKKKMCVIPKIDGWKSDICDVRRYQSAETVSTTIGPYVAPPSAIIHDAPGEVDRPRPLVYET